MNFSSNLYQLVKNGALTDCGSVGVLVVMTGWLSACLIIAVSLGAARTKETEERSQELVSVPPVMRFLMSLVSSLFLHSSKPVTGACLGWPGPELTAELKANGTTFDERGGKGPTE